MEREDRKFMSELSEKILELREQGLSYREIGKQLGCTHGTAFYHCNEIQRIKNVQRKKQIPI